jgi:hypothetical protein
LLHAAGGLLGAAEQAVAVHHHADRYRGHVRAGRDDRGERDPVEALQRGQAFCVAGDLGPDVGHAAGGQEQRRVERAGELVRDVLAGRRVAADRELDRVAVERGDRTIARGDHVAVEERVGRDGEVPREHELVPGDARGGERAEHLGEPRAHGLEQRVVGWLAIAQRGEPRRDRQRTAALGADSRGDRDGVAVAADQPRRGPQQQGLRVGLGLCLRVDLGEVRDLRAGGHIEDHRRALRGDRAIEVVGRRQALGRDPALPRHHHRG